MSLRCTDVHLTAWWKYEHLPFSSQSSWYPTLWMETTHKFFESTHRRGGQVKSFHNVFAHLARSYLSPLAWTGSDWLQMSPRFAGRRAVEQSRPSLKWRFIVRGRLTCQCMIQQIITPSRSADVDGYCVIVTQTNRQNIYHCKITSDIIIGLSHTSQELK